jgi:ethanolamine permease
VVAPIQPPLAVASTSLTTSSKSLSALSPCLSTPSAALLARRREPSVVQSPSPPPENIAGPEVPDAPESAELPKQTPQTVAAEATAAGSSSPYYYASKWHLLALSLLAALTNIYSAWNGCLNVGFGGDLIMSLVLSMTFLFYCASIGEMTSAFPFPGGSYALARCTVGFYPGFLVGCVEIFYYIQCFAYSITGIAYLLAWYAPSLTDYEGLIILLLIVMHIGICSSRRLMWTTVVALTIYTVVINSVYIIGSIPAANFSRFAYASGRADYVDDGTLPELSIDDISAGLELNAPTASRTLFVGSWWHIFRIMGKCCGCFGAEYPNLTVDEVRAPRTEIPFALMIGILVAIVHNIVIYVLASSTSPGADNIQELMLPLLPGLYTYDDSVIRILI